MKLDAKIPEGPLEQKWQHHKDHLKLVSPANKRKYRIIVVGTGLAGSSAAATLAQLGYQVSVFTILDTPRRSHSIAAQGGINAAKNYQNDGDSVWRLFYDTIKGGDYRSREANVYRLAELSTQIIDQAVAQGVPFARDYGGFLDNRSFGGAQVSRTFYARGQTGQQLLLGAYGALMKQMAAGGVAIYPRREMLDLVVVDGHARGIICRNLITGETESFAADAVLLATGGYGNVYHLSTNAQNSNATAVWRCHRRGAAFANPCFTQIHPTCIPQSGHYQSKLTLMSESLRNDGRVWVPKTAGDTRSPLEIPESDRYYFLEERYPSFGNLVPRDVASRNAKEVCDDGLGVGETGRAVYLDFDKAFDRLGEEAIRAKYGNLFDMYAQITGEDPYQTPMRIYPAVHYTMGGLWVDYNLMSTIPGLFVLGEANFSDHGANRLGASALMQGLADGYFVIPYTLGHYLADQPADAVGTDDGAFSERIEEVQGQIDRLMSLSGHRTPTEFHQALGDILWNQVGMSRSESSLKTALRQIEELEDRFWQEAFIPGRKEEYNKYLEFAGRITDYFQLARLMSLDALERKESCGAHYREESVTEDGEARRDDKHYRYVSAWTYQGDTRPPKLEKEPLDFEFVELVQRSYK
jgi:succinate dehydrogenase / fumarate reductase flavoprotein subunit